MSKKRKSAAGGRTVGPLVRPARPLDVLRMERGEIRVHEYEPDRVLISGRLRNASDFQFELTREEAGQLCNAILAQCRMGLPKSFPWANNVISVRARDQGCVRE